MVERSPEKAGVGGSTPSLATMIPITSKHRTFQFCPTLSATTLHFDPLQCRQDTLPFIGRSLSLLLVGEIDN